MAENTYKVRIYEEKTKVKILMLKGEKGDSGGGGGGIYRGETEPTDENILIWIDTSGTTPITEILFITADGKNFITSDNKTFITKGGN